MLKGIKMMQFVLIAVVSVSLVVGFGIKYFFGEVIGEKSQELIENVLKSQTKVDVSTIFDLDDKE